MTEPDHEPLTIMVVEDEKNYRIVLARLFEKEGYRVLLADSPSSAMNLMRQYEVALILTDQRLPGNGGLLFCAMARAEFGDIPCLLFTANATRITRDDLSRAGVISCLSKPFDNQHMLKIVAEALQNKSRKEEVAAECCDEQIVARVNQKTCQKGVCN